MRGSLADRLSRNIRNYSVEYRYSSEMTMTGMSDRSVVMPNPGGRYSNLSLFVLGMHRSGTSAITGALRLCGAWVGEETELIEKNAENSLGFWERRDMRRICDRLLHSAKAEWWKVAEFDPQTIPYEILTEQRWKFEQIVSVLNEHEAWVIKEPRLCLLLPLLRHCVKKPICIHIYRNPLEVARSLQARNGFSISAGLALWEAYNLHALNALMDLPYISISHESLMSHPKETLDALSEDIEEFAPGHPIKPDSEFIGRFIDPVLYHQRATDEETEDYLLPSQRALWFRIRNGVVFNDYKHTRISKGSKQCLLDFESTETKRRDRIDALEEETARLNADLTKRRDRIDALEEETARLNADLTKRRDRIDALEEETARLNADLTKRRDRIDALEEETARLNADLTKRDAIIDELYNSSSWKMTAPLRAVSLGSKWIGKNFRRTFNSFFWRNVFSHAMEIMRSRFAKSREKRIVYIEKQQIAVAERISRLIREDRNRRRRTRKIVRAKPERNEAKTKITVIAWDLGHNPLGRAYLLADVLRHDYHVELIGANFPRFGNDIWKPLRHDSRVTIKNFPGGNFPQHFTRMEDVAKQIEGDVIYVSKPRLPALELAILAKLQKNRPVILDVDDYELGFFTKHEPLTLDEIKNRCGDLDFVCPHDEIWTRYGESLVPLFDQITVSNDELQKKFGGMILPHIRDENDFDPAVYSRDRLRAELGFTTDDKVILFAGTPRMYKGFSRIVAALQNLNRSNYKLLLVGSPVDDEARRFFFDIDSAYVKIVSNVSFFDLPGYLCVSDLICLLQVENEVTSQFQMPAKFTDGLSMGIPMLATNVPPLMNLAKKGLVELLDDIPLDRKIDEIFRNYKYYKHKAIQNREIFLQEYSYGANLPGLKYTIDRLLRNPAPIPDAFHELISYHRKIFSSMETGLDRTTMKVAINGSESHPVKASVRSYMDDKLDIVFFWKQNDTGIYGRRQDMLVKYLAKDSRIHRIFHFDAPVDILKSCHDVAKSSQVGSHSQAGMIFRQLLARKLRIKDEGKIRFDTFIFGTRRHVPNFVRWLLPSEIGYLDYLERTMKRHRIGQRRTVFWVFPNNFHFPDIDDRFQPDLVVADVVDDQRMWPSSPQYRERLHRNYEDILSRSHLVFANCRSVVEGMTQFTDDIHLVPNAAELLEEEAMHWAKPRKLKYMKRPIIGYAGNLDSIRLDLDLLMTVISERPDWNFVFIGSTHRGKDIMKLDSFKNVCFLGVQPYDRTLRYIRYFDVAIIPHLDNELTRNMNPLKLYVYFSLHVPVVATPIANMDDFDEFIRIGRTSKEFIECISESLDTESTSVNAENIRNLLKANSWNERVIQILALIEDAFDRFGSMKSPADPPATLAADIIPAAPSTSCMTGHTGFCTICGYTGHFHREEKSMRESYSCRRCNASLRYREQARLILKYFSREHSDHLADLIHESEFRNLQIYEPGLIGPFRRIFNKLPGYRNSYFWEDVELGDFRKGVQSQDLMNLTYTDNSFDLVLSSDILEHVRKPFIAFREIDRILKPGGFHIFSIPLMRPMPPATVFRVDTSGPEDVFVLPKHYHGGPMGKKSLVYTDFGEDMVDIMASYGIHLRMESPSFDAVSVAYVTSVASINNRMLTFYWKKQIMV